MALIDVSELMVDPDFADEIQIVRSIQSVDATGLAQRAQQTYDAIGVVQAGSGDQLELLPESQRTKSNMTVYTQFQLQEATDTTEADVVLWQGKSYRVMVTSQWTNWGGGYTQATCQLIDLLLSSPGDVQF